MKEYKTFMEGKVLEKRRNVVNHRTTEYQYGSAVRKLQSVPEIHTYEHERRIEEQEQERRQRRREIRRNNRVNLVYTTVLAICATAVFVICYQYLNLQSNIKTNSTAVVELQNQLNSLKAENNSHESEINDHHFDFALFTPMNQVFRTGITKSLFSIPTDCPH